ncbi:peptidylprolyl isomerase [Gloeobacter kilaueensis]|uniref:Peptidyl-prolyl cis-trans isomerase n=1 Tax=Gloeobacter kilaueensis (strain ATCC BAA-2537 / CCAP 1431/1 / ULC 316 / JS1) TaxID=1183438 RepID=U5QLT7_GLOK1|nr:peptidylprolyl isomerase [Gloeobacter kilaueensis]AGY58584.1 peptidyl-prolyl cis-trans isomerase [Gloeobacter kilaueensis JS1]
MQRMRLTLRLFLASAFILAVSACSAVVPPASTQENPKVTNSANVPANLPRLKGKATVELKTNKGPIVLEVDGDNAPVTAGNFVDLVKRKFFDNLTFHRVVPGFVIQGGDPRGNGTGGFIDPATRSERTIPFEIRPTGKDGKPGELLYGSTYSENGLSPRQQPPVLLHNRGALAMARSQNPNSASSQFYITLADTHQLDGEYAVFGKVLKGQEVVDQIRVGDKILSATVVSGG